MIFRYLITHLFLLRERTVNLLPWRHAKCLCSQAGGTSYLGMAKGFTVILAAYFLSLASVVHPLCAASNNPWLQEQQINENGIIMLQKQDVKIELSDEGVFDIVNNVYEEVLHLKETAKFFSEQSISYSSTFTEIMDLEAYSLVPDGKGRYCKHKVKQFNTSDEQTLGIFYDDHKKKTFYYPALAPGAMTVLTYKKKYKEPRFWGSFVFSSYFPVKESIYTVRAPKAVKINYKLFGITGDELEFTMKERGSDLEYQWKASEVAKIRTGNGSSSIRHHAPHLVIYIESYEMDGQTIPFLSDVADLHTWYQKFLSMVETEDSDRELSLTVDNLVRDKTDELQKVKAIYHWVQENIKYIALEDGLGGFVPRHSNTVFQRRYGDCKDMSNLLHDMLEMASIPASLAWIGTNAIPYSHRDVPTPMADNHMICTYVHNGKYYFLDATDPYNRLGTPSFHIQGQEALVNKGASEFELVEVPVLNPEDNMVIDSIGVWFDHDKLVGEGRARFSGYTRIGISRQLMNAPEANMKEMYTAVLHKGSNKFELGDFSADNLEAKDRDLMINYTFGLEDYHLQTGEDIYFNPHLDREFESGLIDKRHSGEDQSHPFKWRKVSVIRVEIPGGYEVSYLPEDASYAHDAFGFDIKYKVDGNQVLVRQQTFLNVLTVKSDAYDAWNEMVRTLHGAYKETFVFSKTH